MNADEPAHDYVEAYYSLRAARVAIVFPADTPEWHFFAKSALWHASQIWGGAGFVLVPHQAGKVSIAVLRAVAAYDPDYVVGHNVAWKELLAAYPPSRETFVDSQGKPLDADELPIADNLEAARDVYTDAARDTVAAVCQVYRRRVPIPTAPLVDRPDPPRWDGAWLGQDESNMFLQASNHLTPVATFGSSDELCVAAPADLHGPWGAWAAALAGVVDRPAIPTPPTDAPADAEELTSWFYGKVSGRLGREFGKPPRSMADRQGGPALSVDTADLPSAWARTTRGLLPVRTAYAPEQLTLVLGDSADDFAFALMWERMWGNTLWVHSQWSPSAEGTVGLRARAATSRLWMQIQRVRRAVVTSVSADAAALETLCAQVNRYGARLELGGPDAEHEDRIEEFGQSVRPVAPPSKQQPRQLVAELPVNFRRSGMHHLAVKEEYSIRTTVPVLRDDKATVMTTTPAALRPLDPDLAGFDLAWHVDVRLDGEPMPRGRGLDGHRLVTSADQEYETWIRSGNQGVSYENKRFDFVSAGANTEQRLARPRIRFLSIAEWCNAMAGQNGYDTGWSDAGRRSRRLERMLGGRAHLTADIAGRFTDLGVAFNREGRTTDEAYPDGIGVMITGVGGFLSFDAMRDILVPRAPVEGSEPEEGPVELEARDRGARREVDRYLQHGILRRGLILGCSTCEAPDFVAVDDLRQRNECRRCGAFTDMTIDAWRQPPSEPKWFYDLHRVARKFLQDHGHAPLWLAHYLSSSAREYADCPELNLLRPGTRSSLAEVDLVAHADGLLITAEVKTSNTLGTTKAERNNAARKRVRWASVLQADEVLLATTTPSWDQPSVDAVRSHLKAAVIDGVFAPDRPPALRLITGLHTDTVSDIYIDLSDPPTDPRHSSVN